MTYHPKELASPFTPQSIHSHSPWLPPYQYSTSSTQLSPSSSSSSSFAKCCSSTLNRTPTSDSISKQAYFAEDSEKQSIYEDKLEANELVKKQSAKPSQKTFWPELLGLRGLGSLLVLRGHMTEDRELMGTSFVSLFFVLSGYLITQSILSDMKRSNENSNIQSHSRNEATSWKAGLYSFVIKRFIRLFPGAVVVLVGTIGLMVSMQHQYLNILYSSSIRAILFLENGCTDYTPFRNFWSLSLEIWCYLLFIFLIPWLHRLEKKNLHFPILGAIAMFSLLIRCMQVTNLGDGNEVWIHPILNIDWKFGFVPNLYKFILGATVYFLKRTNSSTFKKTVFLGRQISLPCLLLITHFSDLLLHRPQQFHLNPSITTSQISVYLDPIVSLLTCWIIYSITADEDDDDVDASKERKWNILASPALLFVGRISYALYLWQHPLLFAEGWSPGISTRLGTTALAFVIAMVSTLLIEEPFQAWASRKMLNKKPRMVKRDPEDKLVVKS